MHEAVLQGGSAVSWSIVDVVLGIGLVLSMLVGLWRGLLTEMLALFGWGVAYFASQWWGPAAGAVLPVDEPGSRLNVLAGMMVVFVATWVAWAVLSWALRQMVRASMLHGTDRALGAGFGLIRGVLVALVLYTLASMTPMTRWEPWRTSRAVPLLGVVLDGLRPVLPARVLEYLPKAVPEPVL